MIDKTILKKQQFLVFFYEESKRSLVYPFKVNIISKGLQIKDYRWVEHDFIGEVKEEYFAYAKSAWHYQRPYTEDWIKVEFITDIDFEEGQQIEMSL